MEGLFTAPAQSFEQQVVEQADIALKALHQAVDYGFFGGPNADQVTVNGSENAADVASMAESYLKKIAALANESSNLNQIVSATLDGGKLIKEPEKRLNSYLKTLNELRVKFNQNDREMKRLAADAIQNIHTAVRTQGGTILSDGSIQGLSRESIYLGANRQLENIRARASNEFIRNQALNGRDAAYNATRSSYQAGINIILETLRNIAGGSAQGPAPAQRPNGGDLTVETTVTTKIKQ